MEVNILASVTKQDFSECIAEKIGLNTQEAKKVVNIFFEEIRLALENGSKGLGYN